MVRSCDQSQCLTRRKTLLCMVVTSGEGQPAVRKHSIFRRCLDHSIRSVAPSFFLFPDRFPRTGHVPSRDTAHRANQAADLIAQSGNEEIKPWQTPFLYSFPTTSINIIWCEKSPLAFRSQHTYAWPWKTSKRLSRSSMQVGCGQ